MAVTVRKKKILFFLACWLSLFAVLSTAGLSLVQRYNRTEFEQVVHRGKVEAEAFAALMNPILGVSISMGSILEIEPDYPHLKLYAERFLGHWHLIKRITLAPNGIIIQAFPEDTGKEVLGFNLFTDPERYEDTQRSRKSRSAEILGPYSLPEGGMGLVARCPVNRIGSDGQETFWGFTSAVVDINSLIADSGLPRLEADGYRWTLTYISGTQEISFPPPHPIKPEGNLLASGGGPLTLRPYREEIPFPKCHIQLSIEPRKGWSSSFWYGLMFLLSWLLSSGFTLIITEFLSYNRKLAREVAERTAAEFKLHQLLEEKDLLMREIHHRIKNNLSIVESIISLQSHEAEGTKFEVIFDELMQRIHSISLIHEKLYRGQNLDRISAPVYIKDLVQFIFDGISKKEAIPIVDVEAVELSTKAALSVGIILTELCTNAVKYGRGGEVKVSLRCENESAILSVENEGPPPPPNYKEASGLGLKLIDTLSHQLEGNWRAEPGPPVAFIVTFPTDKSILPPRENA